MAEAHDATLVSEFTGQAERFNTSAVATDPGLLSRLVRMVAPRARERWLDAACGPGLVSRALAPHVREVLGIDATPAMVELARREADAAGLANTDFVVGDATATGLPSGAFDGGIARFAIHHMPVPSRFLEELARVVAPGGSVVLADHVADPDAAAAAWAQEIERLRDPSHWASLPVERLRSLGERARLTLEDEEIVPLTLDFDDWLERGSGGVASRPLIERALAERPGGSDCFRVTARDGSRTLELRMWIARWRRPPAASA